MRKKKLKNYLLEFREFDKINNLSKEPKAVNASLFVVECFFLMYQNLKKSWNYNYMFLKKDNFLIYKFCKLLNLNKTIFC